MANTFSGMIRFTPSLDPGDARCRLERLIPSHLDPSPFQPDLRRLRRMSAAFAAFCPPPWPAPGLCLTPEIHYQSELWLPLAELKPVFSRFHRAALGCASPLGGAPCDAAASWADVASALPPPLSSCTTPSRLLHRLVTDNEARRIYLFRSSMPKRFYGGAMDRYPHQTAAVRLWLERRNVGEQPLRCLDAACGDGAITYGLVRLLLDLGRAPQDFLVEGWTIDPLEVWAAAHCAFPHDPSRQEAFRRWALPVFSTGAERSLSFRQADLLTVAPDRQRFDLILCNGLLGGPIINKGEEIRRVVESLAALLAPRGLVLAADSFHGGWKQKCPHHEVQALFASAGLAVFEAGEGVGGLKQG
ncbi:bifunctional 2-polyprenyl-6-hydroxyphenol methylase/3-demethylubiquinol 3-O-methyltransferase UbiG [Geobacter sp. AOG2]|uniref:class I SAM-dependent methyltransferase n=1 Tax=Geobacter sp. AOG2 TaxID=1566347 RepID=UPI001CC7CD2F|nr:chemotaxis protein CheR [Geobacter sp. AOG2]